MFHFYTPENVRKPFFVFDRIESGKPSFPSFLFRNEINKKNNKNQLLQDIKLKSLKLDQDINFNIYETMKKILK